jgi:hypothetical protein
VREVNAAAGITTAQAAKEAKIGTTPLVGDIVRDSDLKDLYNAQGSDTDNRAAFVADLATWSDGMAERQWPFLLRVSLGSSSRVSVAVFEDRPGVRGHLEEYEQMMLEEHHQPHMWFSPRVLVGGEDPGTIARLLGH